MSDITENTLSVLRDIRTAAVAAGRRPEEITLVAVSKRQPLDAIEECYSTGQRHFGENYAQELRDKAAALSHLKDIQWHFIGNLQRNKVKYVAAAATTMECIDSIQIAEEFSRRAQALNRTVDVLLQVNVGEEEQKSGCRAADAQQIVDAIQTLSHIRLQGLMTIPPFHLEAAQTRGYFQKLAALRETLGGTAVLPHLSMGMSHDFREAILEGATLVRVGTAIFGERPPRQW